MLSEEELETLDEIICHGNNADFEKDYEEWILEPLIPYESIVILDGLGGSGKSWFALDISYAISLDFKYLGRYPVKKPGHVLYVTAEEVPPRFLKRIDLVTATYGDNENFHWFSTLHKKFRYGTSLLEKEGWMIVRTKTADALEYYMDKYRPTLIVLDSLINFYGLNENDSSEAKKFYEMLIGWIKTYQCSFLLLHHQNKESMKSEEGIFRGSTVFREQARERITYKNVKLENNMMVKKISIEKANYYSPLLEEFPIYLRFDTGTHIYDEELIDQIKREEEKKKSKSEKKSSKGEELKKKKEDKTEPLNLF